MTDIKKLNDDFSVAGQVTPDDLKQAATEGFKSVLNLRSPAETGVLSDEQQQAEALGLDYTNAPIAPTNDHDDAIDQVLWELDNLPKPVLVHCGLGARAGAIALISTAVSNGWTLEELTAKANELGVPLEQAFLKQFIQKTFGDQSRST
ncbi:MAG: protein tyrosine phosphatase family protein [Lyngbya sp. HA4199-MV5]|jgi:uncharacterized protein (TIGR01244 family)|nr:protein tyrosine phosphatase family protein [Lyngbya sp. HA4199-MV5]